MNLADLISGSRTTTTLPPATAILAIPAILNPNQTEKQAKNSRIAEIAIAGSETTAEKPDLYCHAGGCHCSAKLPDRMYPADCLFHNCEYYPRNVRN